MNNVFEVAIIGGGPAGMMAGIEAKTSKNKVIILEKNQSLGKKLLLTGKGRCNLTTSKEIPQIIDAFGKKGKFLYGALTRFSNQNLRQFFEEKGVKLKVERGGRVFPQSDKSKTILNCFEKELKKKKVKINFEFKVKKVIVKDNLFKLINQEETILAKKLIIATGGKSYPQTGSTGDGYLFAQALGHKIIRPEPALVPLIVNDKEINSLAGLSLKNINLSFFCEDKVFLKEFGEMLFTHQGISGPIVLEFSKEVYKKLNKGKKILAQIDLKPALEKSVLKKRIHREIEKMPKKEYQNLLRVLLPRLLIEYVLKITEVDKHLKNACLTEIQISNLINFLKDFRFEITGVMPLKTAIVTSGGIDINEINSKTMESKIVPNLFFAGEIIALDGPTGGYNLQKAFSTGWLAGKSTN
ncbi:aminoacetone oxidase family FAD-binding enzyme [Candidatus Beckwithbacteria bacterium CG10_big_fil_rev_8_21_14_0_10_34_10]|uniref:Aminoacetone oxidase family FAD-binding enzyme n=1 Tax=Candidatus Beckwithbacteria bacterium CG10_big_fil_rev_8_21_14_0_10_34_10 TaxID=1974495 RepID=A0A2H0W8J3_9BACT|nr:MAG: aminoacetone oxidase family FAD-binding enzyme [Candidatus Beckwithbacteria bacterium CG10_big_fil_rev_8_21_14_0_10_34_10]